MTPSPVIAATMVCHARKKGIRMNLELRAIKLQVAAACHLESQNPFQTRPERTCVSFRRVGQL